MLRRGSVTAPLESTIGRDDAVARLAERVATAPLASVVGPVGVGKSRVAQAAAHALRPRFAAGCFLCDVTGVASLDELEARVHALALPLGAALLVLDGADAGLDAVRDVAARWLSVHDERRVIVTAREPLRVAGEACVELAPLAHDDAVALFRRRAPELEGREHDAVHAIVRLVDHLPLAVELCAAQTRVLAPEALLTHLQDADARLDASGGALRRAIGAAWSLLPADVEPVARACAIFEEPFTLDEAAAVAGASLESLRALSERSVVRVVDDGDARRFHMYAPLRDFARSEIAACAREERRALHERHRALFLAQARRPQAHLGTARRNLLASAARDVEHGARAAAREALVAVTPLVLSQGPVAPTLALFAAALEDDEVDAAALHARARLHLLDGRLDAAGDDLAHALRAPGGDRLRAAIVAEQANVHRARGDAAAAQALYEEALGEATREEAALVLERLGGHLFEQGAIDAAQARLAEAEAAYGAVGDDGGRMRAQHARGLVAQEAGALDVAARCFAEARAAHRALGNARFAAIARFDEGALLLERGAPGAARDVLVEALAELEDVGDRRQAALARALLGVCAARRGDREDARALLDRARRELEAVGDAALLGAVRTHAAHVDGAPVDGGVARSDEERYARRVLAGALRADAESVGVAADGSFIEVRGQRAAVASKAGRAILLALVEARQRGDDDGVEAARLFRVGWPGQRVLDDAARNRLQVALSALRRAGLGPILERTADGGYRIATTVRVVDRGQPR